jgi:hypothetical protein
MRRIVSVIALIVAAIAARRAAEAQQGRKVYRIAVVHPSQPVADIQGTRPDDPAVGLARTDEVLP